jgi:hypothetical protein
MLTLIRPQPAPPPDARSILAQHLAECANVRERIEQANEVQRKRDAARAEELRLVAELDAITEAERASWEAWSRETSRGGPPSPKTEERKRAMLALSYATNERMNLDAGLSAANPTATALQGQWNKLASETQALVDAVLVEEAEALAARYTLKLHELILIENALLGLRAEARERNNGTLAGVINDFLRHGNAEPDLHDGAMTLRARWHGLAARLINDANAKESVP